MSDSKPTDNQLPDMLRVIGFSDQGLVLHVGASAYTAGEITSCVEFLMTDINEYLVRVIGAYREAKREQAEAGLPQDEATVTPDDAARAAADEWLAKFSASGQLPN